MRHVFANPGQTFLNAPGPRLGSSFARIGNGRVPRMTSNNKLRWRMWATPGYGGHQAFYQPLLPVPACDLYNLLFFQSAAAPLIAKDFPVSDTPESWLSIFQVGLRHETHPSPHRQVQGQRQTGTQTIIARTNSR